jgi:hypothetical protein
MASKKSVAKCWALLCAAHPNFKPSAETVQVYARFMGETDGHSYPSEQDACLELAVLKCIKTIKFFPSIAELLDARERAPYVLDGQRERLRNAEEYKQLEAQETEAKEGA